MTDILGLSVIFASLFASALGIERIRFLGYEEVRRRFDNEWPDGVREVWDSDKTGTTFSLVAAVFFCAIHWRIAGHSFLYPIKIILVLVKSYFG